MLTRLQCHTFDSCKHHKNSAVNTAAPFTHRGQHTGNSSRHSAQIDALTDCAGQALHKGDLIEVLGNKVTELALAFARPLGRSLALQISKKLIKTIHTHIVPAVTPSNHGLKILFALIRTFLCFAFDHVLWLQMITKE